VSGTTQLAGGWLSTDNTFTQCFGTQSPLSYSNYALLQNNVGTILQTVGYTAFQTSGTERMRLISSGYLGIGTTTPAYRLDVAGDARVTGTLYPSGGISTSSGAFQFTGPYAAYGETPRLNFTVTSLGNTACLSAIGGPVGDEQNQTRLRFYTGNRESMILNTVTGRVGIYNKSDPSYDMDINGSLRYASATQSSDRRIKKNIVDVNDSSALDKLRLLKPKIYEYIDPEKRTDKVVYGFIAQEVQEVLDYAVYQNTDPIPNIFEAAIATSTTLQFTTFDTSTLSRDKNGTLFRLVVKTKDSMLEYANIVDIVDEHTLRVDRDLRYLCEHESLFVYGQEVDDFHTLTKDAIWTVTTAALQEVDRQLQAEKEKTATLQSEVQTLKQMCVSLQQTQDQLLSRIVALESKGSA